VSQIVTDQTSRFAYALVANGDGNGNSQISAYTIDPATGALTLISTTPTPAGIGAYEISPFGSVNAAADLLLYVADTTNNQILGFNIDSTTGALSATPGSPFAAGSQPNYLTYSPANGGTIYSSNLGNSEIGVYQITAIGGVIGPLSPMAESSCGTTPDPGNCFSVAGNGSTSGIAVDASSQFLYVQNQSSGATYGLNIDSTLGTLSNLVSYPGTPYPNGDATDALDRFVFAANGNTNNITVYTLGDGGALTQVSGSPFAAANPAYGLANILVTP
jgi:6-phosphogluconolactonase (cycloisomerase 2 family)